MMVFIENFEHMEGNRSGRAISFHMLKILNENYHEKGTNKCLIAIQDKLAPLMECWPRHWCVRARVSMGVHEI